MTNIVQPRKTVAPARRASREPAAARYVWQAPVRAWHVVHGVSIVVLAVTGWFIANPLPSIHGEASSHFIMGDLRFVHLVAAHVFTVAFLVRLYWAFAGDRNARELFLVPVWRRDWWKGLWHSIRYYGFLTRESREYRGHNPLAQLTYFLFNVVLVVVLIATGYALHAEQLGHGSWADTLFGWVVPLLGNSQEVRMWHYLAMWIMIAFVVIHVYMAFRADVVDRHDSIGSMVDGWRVERTGKQGPE